MAHDVLVLCVFLLIRPCCRQLQWAGSSVRRYLLKWEGERGSTGLIYCLCRGESERGGVKSEKEKPDSSFESLELSETGWSLSRVKEESKWMKRCWFFFFPPSSAGDFSQTSLLLHILRFFCVPLLGICYRPHLTAAQQKPLWNYPACFTVCRELCLDAFLVLEGENPPAVLLSPVWVQTQPWEFQDSLSAAFPHFIPVCLFVLRNCITPHKFVQSVTH